MASANASSTGRRMYAVEITRTNGTTFLATAAYAPTALFYTRRAAGVFQGQLITECRLDRKQTKVLPVWYTHPTVLKSPAPDTKQ